MNNLEKSVDFEFQCQHKVCNTCKVLKSVFDFYKDKHKKDGLTTQCKVCKDVANRLYQQTERGKEICRLADARFRKTEKAKIISKRHRSTEKGKITSKRSSDKFKKSEKGIKYIEEWNKSEARKESSRKYYLKNKKDYVARLAFRRASKRQATPKWLTKEQLQEIKDFYTACDVFKIYTGLTYHVDHMIPLVHPLVCGLHVPWNLQILEASENLRKNNKLLEEFENAF